MKAGVRDSTYATYSAIVTNRVLNDDVLCAVPADMLSILNTVPHRFRLVHHEPKTQAGCRTVPVLSEFVHVVREHVDTNKSARASVPSLLHPLGHRPLKPMALFVTG